MGQDTKGFALVTGASSGIGAIYAPQGRVDRRQPGQAQGPRKGRGRAEDRQADHHPRQQRRRRFDCSPSAGRRGCACPRFSIRGPV
jgi:hypothetical protein